MNFIDESVDRTLNGAFLGKFYIGYPAKGGLDTLYFCPAREKESTTDTFTSQSHLHIIPSTEW